MNFIDMEKKKFNFDLPWEQLENKSILISGASGMIGTYLIQLLMERKETINIVALGRNIEKSKVRFSDYWDKSNFKFYVHDITYPIEIEEKVDYIIHAASNTHPIAYATDPIGTITANTVGTINLLDFAVKCNATRFLFLSSVEIYGENRGDVDRFTEDYCGYIDCNTLRAGYPESKRVGEALCQAYLSKYNLDITIARLSRIYGPTMQKNDSKAIAQFIKNGVTGNDIVLKSKGQQLYSYSYVADAVSGILTILLKGKRGEAYNIADEKSDITLCDLAYLIADYTHRHVVFECPDDIEAAGNSNATVATLNAGKLGELGWEAQWNIKEGIEYTIDILKLKESSL